MPCMNIGLFFQRDQAEDSSERQSSESRFASLFMRDRQIEIRQHGCTGDRILGQLLPSARHTFLGDHDCHKLAEMTTWPSDHVGEEPRSMWVTIVE